MEKGQGLQWEVLHRTEQPNPFVDRRTASLWRDPFMPSDGTVTFWSCPHWVPLDFAENRREKGPNFDKITYFTYLLTSHAPSLLTVPH